MKPLKILIFLLFLFSCEKLDQTCYKCLIEKETYFTQMDITRIEYKNTYPCVDDIEAYKIEHSGLSSRIVKDGIYGEVLVETKTTCKCEEMR